MQNTMETLNRTLHNKLQKLVSFLGQITSDFNAVAEEIDNEGLSSCETYFNKLYAEVLQENLPSKNCKDIISFQLYAINCALMKIKLLNATRFNQELV